MCTLTLVHIQNTYPMGTLYCCASVVPAMLRTCVSTAVLLSAVRVYPWALELEASHACSLMLNYLVTWSTDCVAMGLSLIPDLLLVRTSTAVLRT